MAAGRAAGSEGGVPVFPGGVGKAVARVCKLLVRADEARV